MSMSRSAAALGQFAALMTSTSALAQTAPSPDQMDNVNKGDKALTPGANSFTEAQARSWLEDAGYTDVGTLMQSDDGIWRGQAKHNGATVTVAVDYKGTISTE